MKPRRNQFTAKSGQPGDRIARAMAFSGLRQSELGRRAGLSKSALSRWLYGDGVPPSDASIRLARVLGVRPEYLLLLDDRMLSDEPAPPSRPEAKLISWIKANSCERDVARAAGRSREWLQGRLTGEFVNTVDDREAIRLACSLVANRAVPMSTLFSTRRPRR